MSESMPELFALDVRAENGVPFRVLLLTGARDAPSWPRRRNETEPTVEFFDRRVGVRNGFSEHGQFVSCYTLSTLVDGSGAVRQGPITLHGGVPAWTIDAATMWLVGTWLTCMIVSLGIEST